MNGILTIKTKTESVNLRFKISLIIRFSFFASCDLTILIGPFKLYP